MNLRAVLAVSIWEFRRFCKVKDLLMTLAFWVVGGLVYVVVMAIVARSTEADLARIVVLNPDVLAFDASDVVAIEAANERDEVTLRRLVDDGDLDGVLILHAVDRAVLIVPGDRLWQGQLQSILDAAVRDARLRDSDLAADDLERLTAPFDLELALSGGIGHQPRARSARPGSRSVVAFRGSDAHRTTRDRGAAGVLLLVHVLCRDRRHDRRSQHLIAQLLALHTDAPSRPVVLCVHQPRHDVDTRAGDTASDGADGVARPVDPDGRCRLGDSGGRDSARRLDLDAASGGRQDLRTWHPHARHRAALARHVAVPQVSLIGVAERVGPRGSGSNWLMPEEGW